MDGISHLIGHLAAAAAGGFIWTSCLLGLALACLGLSGVWLVVLATVVAACCVPGPFPEFGTVMLFLYFAVAAEVGDMVLRYWGWKGRGGPVWIGVIAMGGGLAGLATASVLPWAPLQAVGLLLGSLGAVCLFEYHRQAPPSWWQLLPLVLRRDGRLLVHVIIALGLAAWLLHGMR